MSDIYDILLDENNTEPIVIDDGNGRKLTFEQLAVFPDHEKLYCILKPLDKYAGIVDDEKVVFYVEYKEEGQEPVLQVETDEEKIQEIYAEYEELLAEKEEKEETDSEDNADGENT